MEIKVLARRGTAVREIARQTGRSRNTLGRYLREGQAGRYNRASHARRSSTRSRAICSNVSPPRGHTGFRQRYCFGNCARSVTKTASASSGHPGPAKRVAAEPVVRFETPRGKQMQADFTAIRRGRAPLVTPVATLRYSLRASCALLSARTPRRCASAWAKRSSPSAARPSRCCSTTRSPWLLPVVSKLRRVLPRESLQHPLAAYDALLEMAA